MHPHASNANNRNELTDSTSNRRYSLFARSTATSQSQSRPLDKMLSLNLGVETESGSQTKQIATRKDMIGQFCQRCKRMEVDLTNTSDDLNATDAELKASRQVISLLQRQLELFRVEKEGLEKLIISQSEDPLKVVNGPPQATELEDLLNGAEICPRQEGGREDLAATQKYLLKLIHTQLYAKDEEIVKLKFNLKEAQNDKEQLTLQLHLVEEDNTKLKSDNTVLNENIALRDQTIVSLSNEVFEQGNLNEFSQSSTRRQSSIETSGNQISLLKAQRHIAKLIDTLEAYKKTNELLSNNVMKLTEKCTQAEKKEIEARSQCQELEAKCCQIQSKLLSLLKEIEQSTNQTSAIDGAIDSQATKCKEEFICSESVKLLIKRLLEDKSLDIPLSWKEGNRANREKKDDVNNKYECDELGFYIIHDRDKDTSSSDGANPGSRKSKFREDPSTSAFHLNTVSELSEINENDEDKVRKSITHQISVDATKSDEARWHMRWDDFIKDFDRIDLAKSKDFKTLLRSGVPQEYRCKIWKALVNIRIGRDRQRYGQDYYQSLLEPNRPQASSKQALNPSSKQIELDLLRTLPNNKHFETLDSSGTVRLRRVLIAYSQHNPKVGYCQGMNRLAAVALLVLPEEEAFWCLVTIIENIMPKGYYNDLWLAQVDSSVVMDFLSIKMPNLSDHFRQYGVDLSLFAWFLTIFVDGTPPAVFLRLWDCFLYEGDKILFRVALALLRMHEGQLLKLNNSVAINNFLRTSVNEPMDMDQFFDIAFDWINPLSSRSLKAKRQYNFELMRSGFENAGRSFMTPSPTNSADDRDMRNSKNDDSPYEDSSIISI